MELSRLDLGFKSGQFICLPYKKSYLSLHCNQTYVMYDLQSFEIYAWVWDGSPQ